MEPTSTTTLPSDDAARTDVMPKNRYPQRGGMGCKQIDDTLVAVTNEVCESNKGNIGQSSPLIDKQDASLFEGSHDKSNTKRVTILQRIVGIPKILPTAIATPSNQQYTPVAESADGLIRDEEPSKSESPGEDNRSASFHKSSPEKKRPSIHWSHVKEQLRLIIRIGLPYFQESSSARWLVASLLFFLLLNNGMYIFFSFVNRDFWSALANQNAHQFYKVMVLYFATLLLLMAPINAWYNYQRDQLVLHWRSWLTQRTLELYTTHQVYFHMEQERNQSWIHDDTTDRDWNRTWIDNPDQRITEDVKAFTDLSIALCFEFFDSVIQVGSFSAILWTIDPQLLGLALLYAVGGTMITTLLGHPLIQLNVEHLRREADLRYSLIRFREHAEAIAFYLSAAIFEHHSISKRLHNVVTNQYRINLINRTLNLFTYAYSLSLDILPVIIVVRSS
jgi:hypothetical protein